MSVEPLTSLLASLLARGYQSRRDHRLADARAAFAEAVDIGRTLEDPRLLAQSLQGLGQIERDLGENEAALQRYQEAVIIQRTLDDPLALAHSIRHVGDILRESDQLSPAAPCYEEALDLYRRHSGTNTLDLANTLRGFALLKSANGATEQAITLWQEAAILYAKADVQAGVVESEKQLALLATP